MAKVKVFQKQREKGDLTQFYDKTPYTNRKFEKQWTTQKATKNFDYIAIAHRLRTVSCSNNSQPTGVVERVNRYPTFPLTAKAV